MADTSPSTPPAARPSKPVSEALLNDKWDRAISSFFVRSAFGLGFGIFASVVVFKRRTWPAFVGLGFGAGMAFEEADAAFKKGGAQTGRDGVRLVRS